MAWSAIFQNAWRAASPVRQGGEVSDGKVRRVLPIILIDNIDLLSPGPHPEAMTTHHGIERRYVDQLLVASAICISRG
jgi:hypothetical protein